MVTNNYYRTTLTHTKLFRNVTIQHLDGPRPVKFFLDPASFDLVFGERLEILILICKIYHVNFPL